MSCFPKSMSEITERFSAVVVLETGVRLVSPDPDVQIGNYARLARLIIHVPSAHAARPPRLKFPIYSLL